MAGPHSARARYGALYNVLQDVFKSKSSRWTGDKCVHDDVEMRWIGVIEVHSGVIVEIPLFENGLDTRLGSCSRFLHLTHLSIIPCQNAMLATHAVQSISRLCEVTKEKGQEDVFASIGSF